jgi:outer membrane protein TolC
MKSTSLSLRKLISVLIAGNEKAKSEIQQADAYVAEAVGRRLAGEQAVFEARQALGVAMGLDRTGLRYAPLAAEPFPGPNGLEHVANNQDRLIAAALELRADYRASIKAQESAQAMMDAARLDLLPQMNFQIKASYFGGDTDVSFEGFEHSFFGHQTGVSAVGQLQFDWPIENQVARGNFVTYLCAEEAGGSSDQPARDQHRIRGAREHRCIDERRPAMAGSQGSSERL